MNPSADKRASVVPTCVGIILDGNRRWAKENGLPSLEGHRRGADRAMTVARHARDRGVKHLVYYAFSTENWNREPAEVEYLMDLFLELFEQRFTELVKENVRIRFIGSRDRLSQKMRMAMEKVEQEGMRNDTTLWICLSYGGRAEITAAAQALAAEGVPLTEESLHAHMWSAEMPDPDLVIRTGGEKRLSNFLTWQSVYSELFFTDTKWPAFTEEEFDSILEAYARRERRHGI